MTNTKESPTRSGRKAVPVLHTGQAHARSFGGVVFYLPMVEVVEVGFDIRCKEVLAKQLCKREYKVNRGLTKTEGIGN